MLKPPKQVPLSSVPKLGRGLGNGSKYVDLDELSNEENHSCHVNTRDIPIEMKTSHEKAASILKGKEIPPPDPNSCSLRIQKFQYRNPSKSESSGSIRKY